jgi:hypothetical protein
VLARGEGVSGLSQAFLHAGADAVQASLLDVPDRFAGRLMLRFHESLRRGKSPAEALRSAQRQAMDWPGIPAALWSSFLILGDGGSPLPLTGPAPPPPWLPALAAPLVLALVAAWLFLRARRGGAGGRP